MIRTSSSTAGRRRALLLGATSCFTLMATSAWSQSLEGIGQPVPGFHSYGAGVSADGRVVVGQAITGSGTSAVFWTGANGLTIMGDLPGGAHQALATAADADGSIIVGYGTTAAGEEAFRYEAGTMVPLGLPTGATESQAWGVSADGAVIAGHANFGSRSEAFRWTQGTGFELLGGLDTSNIISLARGMSADGDTIVGWSRNASGINEAFRWTRLGGMSGLGILSGYAHSVADAVSDDGQVVVGWNANSGNNQFEAFRWEGGSMTSLGFLPGHTSSRAFDTNADGSVVVGASQSSAPLAIEAFYWRQGDGMRSLEDILTAAGVNLGSWQLEVAEGVSADGLVVVGAGQNPSGDDEGWWARIAASPPPPPPPPPPGPPAPPPPPPPPPPPSGFLSNTVLERSVNSTAALISAVIAESNRDHLMRMSRVEGERGDMRAWAIGGGRSYDGDISDSESAEGDLGLSYQATRALRVGAGFRWSTLDGDLPAYDGQAELETRMLQAFVAYEPDEHGWRGYLGGAFGHGEASIDRGYLNGVTPEISRGERDVEVAGLTAIAGWSAPIGGADFMPFVRYDITHIDLDGYAETGGAFPAVFDEIDDDVETLRVGAEARTLLSDALEAQGSLAWSHGFNRRLPAIRGEVTSLMTGFFVSGAEIERDWTEAHASLVWSPRDGTNVRFGLGASTDGDTAPELSASIGIDMRL